MPNLPKPKPRRLILSDSVDRDSVKGLIKSILEINEDDQDKEELYNDWKRYPIELYINTYGGSVYDGLGLINAMELSKTPVHTIAMGSAMSMGLFILISGHKRFVGPYATVMYHQISTFAWDKLEGIKDQVKEAERLEKVCEELLFRRTKIKNKHIAPYKKQKSEWYIDPKEALKRGIVDEILVSPTEPQPHPTDD